MSKINCGKNQIKPIARVYEIQDVDDFYVESCDCSGDLIQIVMDQQEIRMTHDAFLSFAGSIAGIASRFMNEREQKQGKNLHQFPLPAGLH